MVAKPRKRPLPITKLNNARDYLVAQIQSLRHIRGTVWVFVCAATMIDYLASLENGAPAGRKRYIGFIKDRMRVEYCNFEYIGRYRRAGTGVREWGTYIPREITKCDLPEQMYYMFRCGLVHGFSLVPSSQEKTNGARARSIALSNRKDASKDGKNHLDNYVKAPYIADSAYFVDEDLLDDLIAATTSLFADTSKHQNISKMLKERPFIWPL